MFIIAGVITTAAATEEVLLHPSDAVHTEFLVMFVGGIALFFGGISLGVFRAYRVLANERLLATAAIGALAYLGRSWDGVTLLVAVDVILFACIVAEHLRIEGVPETTHTPTTAA